MGHHRHSSLWVVAVAVGVVTVWGFTSVVPAATTTAPAGIWQAAQSGDAGLVRQLAARGVDVNAPDDLRGWTPLIYAISKGHTEAVRALLDAGADPSNRSRQHSAPLDFAAVGGHLEVIRLLVAKGADVNASEPPKLVPLAYAAENGKLEAIRLLVQLGAKVDEGGREGFTALFRAAGADQAEAIALLVQFGARVDARSRYGLTAVSAAAARGRVKALKALLSNGGDARDNNGEQSAIGVAAENGHRDAVLLLADHGADINIDLNFEDSVLNSACANGDAVLARELLRRGATSQRANRGLELAALAGSAECLQIMLGQGTRLEDEKAAGIMTKALDKGNVGIVVLLRQAQRRWKGVAAGPAHQRADQLLLAAHGRDAAAVRSLLDDAAAQEDEEVLALALKVAEQQGDIAVMRLVRPVLERALARSQRRRDSTAALLDAIRRSDLNVGLVRTLVEAGADVNACEAGATALGVAARLGQTDTARFLLDHGARTDWAHSHLQYNIVDAAIQSGSIEMVKLVVARGAKLEHASRHPPLVAAAYVGRAEVVEFLLQSGADVDARGGAKRTALMAAAERGHQDVVRLLLSKGASVNARDVEGDTALSLARKRSHAQVEGLLVAGGTPGAAPVKRSLEDAMRLGVDAVKAALDQGADPNATGATGDAPLTYALQSVPDPATRVAVIRVLLERGADPARIPGLLRTAVYYESPVEVLQLLIRHDVPVNDQEGWSDMHSPLTAAVERGYLGAVRVLLEAGADPTLRTVRGEDALELARKSRRRDIEAIVQQALDRRAKTTTRP